MSILPRVLPVALLFALAPPVHAGSLSAGWTPRVPVSGLAFPTAWFDPARLHISSSLSVGSGGFGVRGTNALQVTSLAYDFSAPLHVGVSLGNAWGSAGYASSKMFLEGLDLTYHPSPGLQFQIQYRDVRSPLQFATGGSQFGPAHWTTQP